MSGNSLQLFLDRFLLVNKERYKNDPNALAILNGLTLEQLTFSNWQSKQDSGKPIQQTVDMDIVNKLVAHAQKYYTLDFASPLVSKPVDATPVAEADLTSKAKTGLYFYNDTSTTPARIACAVVVRAPKDLYSEGVAVIKASCLFDLDDGEIAKNSDGTAALVSSKTFVDTIKILQSTVTEFLYDGTYKYDGTMTY